MALHTRLSNLAICVLGATTAAAHVLVPFSHRGELPNLSARASSEQTPLKSVEVAYVVDVEVGTPAQKLSLAISPSAGDTWVPNANTPECSPDWYYDRSYYSSREIPDSVCIWGSFNKSRSETYLPANSRYSEFTANDGSRSYVSGVNMTDKLVVGDMEIDDYPMGLVSSGSRWLGVLGLGSNKSSSSYSSSYSERGDYVNFMDRIVSSGKAATPAYSMWLNDAEGTSGSLLFGAVDRSRYTGNLLRLQADAVYSYSSYDYSNAFGAVITSINGTTDSGSTMPPIRTNDFPVDVTIGPAEIFSYLPESLAGKIAAIAGATYNESLGYYTIPCDAAETNSAKFAMQLGGTGGPILNFETADLVISSSFYSNSWYYRLSSAGICFFGVQQYYSSSSSSSSTSYGYNIGNSLLRRTYMVFDVANQELALAPARFASKDAPSPTIVAFGSYGAKIPYATLFCTSSQCGYECSFGNCISPTSTSSSGSGNGSGSTSYTNSQRDHWRTVAIALGVTFGILVLIGIVAAAVICTRLRREKVAAKEVEDAAESGPDAAALNGNGTRGPTTLPVIQESQEPAADTTRAAPQLPALGTQPPITPAEPVASSRVSMAVSALSDDHPAVGQEATGQEAAGQDEAARSPTGKGKQVDHSA